MNNNMTVTVMEKDGNLSDSILQTLLGTLDEGVLITDNNGTISHVNSSLLVLTGCTAHELLGQNLLSKFPESPASKAFLTQKPYFSEKLQFHFAGTESSCAVTPVMQNQEFNGIVAVFKKGNDVCDLMTELRRSTTLMSSICDRITAAHENKTYESSDLISLDRMEQVLLKQALNKFGSTVEGKKMAAKALNISLATLYNKLKKYQIS